MIILPRMPVWHGTALGIALFKVAKEAPYTVVGQSIPGKYSPNDIPLLSYCYWQTCELAASMESRYIPVTDRPIKRIANDGFLYTCKVNGFFCYHREISAIDILNRNNRFQIIAFHYDPVRSEPAIVHSLKMCTFFSVNLNDTENGISNYNVDIGAEEYDNYLYY